MKVETEGFSFSPAKDGGLCLDRYIGTEKRVEVPAEYDGRKVTEIGDYAFAESPITHLALSATVTRTGRYALYRCAQLEELSFWNSLKDFGAGTFTGCHRIRRLTVDFEDGRESSLRDVLMEIQEELLLDMRFEGKEARLWFPEYYEEGVENTPARIIEHHTHGSGLLYRNCFVNRCFRFAEYDGRFPFALGQERETLLIRLVLERLSFPIELSATARQTYEDYLQEHFDEALKLYTCEKDQAAIAFLMDLRHKKAGVQRLSFDL